MSALSDGPSSKGAESKPGNEQSSTPKSQAKKPKSSGFFASPLSPFQAVGTALFGSSKTQQQKEQDAAVLLQSSYRKRAARVKVDQIKAERQKGRICGSNVFGMLVATVTCNDRKTKVLKTADKSSSVSRSLLPGGPSPDAPVVSPP